MSVLEQVAAVRESRRKAAQARVAELAHLAVEGQQVDATEVADTLDAAGLADGWFAERVAHIERRKGQLAMVAHQADYEQQRATAEATMKEAGAKLEVANAITTRSMARRGMSFKRLANSWAQSLRPGKSCDERPSAGDCRQGKRDHGRA